MIKFALSILLLISTQLYAQQSFDGVTLLESVDLNKRISELTQKYKKQNHRDRHSESKKSISLFYLVSQGTFSDQVGSLTYENGQNSLGTIGLSIDHSLSDSYKLYTQFYFSYLSPTYSDSSIANDKLNIPMEWEFFSQLELQPFKIFNKLTTAFGAGVEKISTFNSEELSVTTYLQTRQQMLFYINAGLNYSFNLLNRPAKLRAKISKSLFTSESRPSEIIADKYSGIKIDVSFQTAIYKDWSMMLFIKQHSLTGATDLSITRVGGGIIYQL
jgi:hypothetical protein